MIKKSTLRWIVNIFFLLLIFILWFTGKVKLWMILILLSLLAVPFKGRIYCGWICPVFTSLKLWEKITGGKASPGISGIFEKRWLQVIVSGFLAVLFLVLNRMKSPVPYFIVLIPLALIFAGFFGQEKWHRLCPFGVVFSWLNSIFQKGTPSLQENCLGCGSCIDSCPGGSITLSGEIIAINSKYCLSCGECQEKCPVDP